MTDSVTRSSTSAPAPVKVATVILYLYAVVLIILGCASIVAMGRDDVTASESRQLAIAAAVLLLVGAVVAVLAGRLRQGHRWALWTILALLFINAFQAAIRDTTGFANLGVAILISLLLLVPRSSREYFGIGTGTG